MTKPGFDDIFSGCGAVSLLGFAPGGHVMANVNLSNGPRDRWSSGGPAVESLSDPLRSARPRSDLIDHAVLSN
jgi:hypothetical protein